MQADFYAVTYHTNGVIGAAAVHTYNLLFKTIDEAAEFVIKYVKLDIEREKLRVSYKYTNSDDVGSSVEMYVDLLDNGEKQIFAEYRIKAMYIQNVE